MNLILLPFIFTFLAVNAQAQRIILHPLNAPQVYRLLAHTGRSADIPEGRIITQGLTLIGNISQRFIGGGNQVRVRSQEVCFETRSARSFREAEQVYDSYVAASNRREDKPLGKRVRSSEVSRILKLKKRKKLRDAGEVKGNRRIRNDDEESEILFDSNSRSGAEIDNNSPHKPTLISDLGTATSLTTTDMKLAPNSDITDNKKLSDAILSTFTTSTTPEGSINCIVIRKNE